MEVLILGGTGAMGKPLAHELAKRGHKVFVTTRSARDNRENLIYIQGNPHNHDFVEQICKRKYDVIVDFMIYESDEFRNISKLLLDAANQYVFISSARVYADSATRITEKNYRLLDVTEDQDYLKTNEYALKKAREEDILKRSGNQNWTIVRPYITYNTNRLQLGTLEKEYWLRRALEGKTAVLTKYTAQARTSLTYGDDFSKYLLEILGNEKAIGQVFHIVNEESLTWKEILNIYSRVFESVEGKPLKYKILDDATSIGLVIGNTYQMKYDRFYNREFDSSKIMSVTGRKQGFITIECGLEKCLREFLNNPKFENVYNWRYEGYVDRICHEKTRLSSITGNKNKILYLIWRWIPSALVVRIRKLRT